MEKDGIRKVIMKVLLFFWVPHNGRDWARGKAFGCTEIWGEDRGWGSFTLAWNNYGRWIADAVRISTLGWENLVFSRAMESLS